MIKPLQLSSEGHASDELLSTDVESQQKNLHGSN